MNQDQQFELAKQIAAAMPTESEEEDIPNDDALNAMNDAINIARAALDELSDTKED